MSLSYSGPATLHLGAEQLEVTAVLRTDLSGGVYSWGGRLTAGDLAAFSAAGSGGILTVPGCNPAEVLIVAAEPHIDGGILLRIHGNGRAPYEKDGDIVTRLGAEGETIHELAREAGK